MRLEDPAHSNTVPPAPADFYSNAQNNKLDIIGSGLLTPTQPEPRINELITATRASGAKPTGDKNASPDVRTIRLPSFFFPSVALKSENCNRWELQD